jgi:hypothetical protein
MSGIYIDNDATTAPKQETHEREDQVMRSAETRTSRRSTVDPGIPPGLTLAALTVSPPTIRHTELEWSVPR